MSEGTVAVLFILLAFGISSVFAWAICTIQDTAERVGRVEKRIAEMELPPLPEEEE